MGISKGALKMTTKRGRENPHKELYGKWRKAAKWLKRNPRSRHAKWKEKQYWFKLRQWWTIEAVVTYGVILAIAGVMAFVQIVMGWQL